MHVHVFISVAYHNDMIAGYAILEPGRRPTPTTRMGSKQQFFIE
jgi:hypothetical protein